MLSSFDALLKNAAENPKIISVAAAEDPHVIEAVLEAKKRGIADFVLTGDEAEIVKLIESHHGQTSDFTIINTSSFEEAAEKAVEAVKQGKANALMKGLTPSPLFLKAALQELKKENGLLAHVALMEVPGWEKMFLASDCAVNIQPDLDEKEKIIHHSLTVARKLGISNPNVALVTASEKVNPKMKDTQHAELLTQKANEGVFGDANVAGPYALDNAISKEAAEIKKVTYPGAGEADVLIMPDLNAANIFYKAMIFFAKAQSAGIILGAQVPIILVSRADSEETKLHSIALACVVSEK